MDEPVNHKYKIHELLFPWMRLERIQRELDAEERSEGVKLYIHYWTKVWPKQQIALYHKPLLFTQFFKTRE